MKIKLFEVNIKSKKEIYYVVSYSKAKALNYIINILSEYNTYIISYFKITEIIEEKWKNLGFYDIQNCCLGDSYYKKIKSNNRKKVCIPYILDFKIYN